jgi:hypothetical protein
MLYIILIVTAALWGAVRDLRGAKRHVLHVIGDLTSASALIVLMLGRWHQGLVAPLGYWAAGVFAALVVWDIYSTSRDLAEIRDDPAFSPRVNAISSWAGLLTGGISVAPAYALALMGVANAWRGAAIPIL